MGGVARRLRVACASAPPPTRVGGIEDGLMPTVNAGVDATLSIIIPLCRSISDGYLRIQTPATYTAACDDYGGAVTCRTTRCERSMNRNMPETGGPDGRRGQTPFVRLSCVLSTAAWPSLDTPPAVVLWVQRGLCPALYYARLKTIPPAEIERESSTHPSPVNAAEQGHPAPRSA
jgi:hypothetical protein